MEAHLGENVGSPMVNMRIEPTGTVSILSTHEQIFCPARNRIGTSMPATSAVSNVLFETAQAIGNSCWAAGRLAAKEIVCSVDDACIACKRSCALALVHGDSSH